MEGSALTRLVIPATSGALIIAFEDGVCVCVFFHVLMTITLDLLALAVRIRLQRLKGSSALLPSPPRAGDPISWTELEQMVAGFKFGWITEFIRCCHCFQKAPQNQAQTY